MPAVECERKTDGVIRRRWNANQGTSARSPMQGDRRMNSEDEPSRLPPSPSLNLRY